MNTVNGGQDPDGSQMLAGIYLKKPLSNLEIFELRQAQLDNYLATFLGIVHTILDGKTRLSSAILMQGKRPNEQLGQFLEKREANRNVFRIEEYNLFIKNVLALYRASLGLREENKPEFQLSGMRSTYGVEEDEVISLTVPTLIKQVMEQFEHPTSTPTTPVTLWDAMLRDMFETTHKRPSTVKALLERVKQVCFGATRV